MKLFLATKDGVAVVEDERWQVVQRGLNGRYVTSIIAREGVILAGTTDGIFRSEDEGQSWQEVNQGLTVRHVRWLAYHPDISDCEFAGVEPAAIFVSRNGGESWRECPEVTALRQQHGWWLPYSPEAGCVRGFAFHGQRAYAAVEVGAALRSDDGGQSWQLAPGSNGRPRFGTPPAQFVHPDVHSVATHPSTPDYVFAPTGGGFYASTDGGHTWHSLYANCYVRAVWVDPANAQRLVLGPAQDSSGRSGRIEVSEDGGQSWQMVNGRWANNRWAANMVERFVFAAGRLLAVMANGELLAAPLPNLHPLSRLDWSPVLPHTSGVQAMTTMGGK